MSTTGIGTRSPRSKVRYGVAFSLLVGLFMALCVLLPALPAFAAMRSVPDAGTARTDGRVYAILRVGDKIYMAGNFYHVNGVERQRFAAINANTGALTDWSPKANASVFALAASPDGSRIYAGGDFTRSNAADRGRLVALDAVTGQTVDGWNATANGAVRSIAVSGDRVYLGGTFTSVNGLQRVRLAMVDGSDGSVAPDWRPSATGPVYKVAVSGDRLYVGGYFARISGKRVPHLAALNPNTGGLTRWRPRGTRPVIDMVAGRTRVYTAEGGRGGGAVSSYSAGRGTRAWTRTSDGDCQTIAFYGRRLYVGGHFDRLDGKARSGLAALSSAGGRLNPWAPRANLGVWEITPDVARRKLYVGGDFTRMTKRDSFRFARFTG